MWIRSRSCGELTEVDTGVKISGAEHRALAAVQDLAGSLLGFVSVGIGVRSVHQIVLDTMGCFAILTFLARRPGPVPQPVPLHQGRPAGL